MLNRVIRNLLNFSIISMVIVKYSNEPEAVSRSGEYLDMFESGFEHPVDPLGRKVVILRWSGAQQYPCFELRFDDQLFIWQGFPGRSELTSLREVHESLCPEAHQIRPSFSIQYWQPSI